MQGKFQPQVKEVYNTRVADLNSDWDKVDFFDILGFVKQRQKCV